MIKSMLIGIGIVTLIWTLLLIWYSMFNLEGLDWYKQISLWGNLEPLVVIAGVLVGSAYYDHNKSK